MATVAAFEMDQDQLLARYVSEGSSQAYEALVRHYADLVYNSARRQLGDSHLAEDVTQSVFILLTRKASRVRGPLGGWLVRATVYACRNARRVEYRRQLHERRAAQMKHEATASPQPAGDDYAPLLDEAFIKLSSADRNIVTLRFLMGHNIKEISELLGISELAARKRIDRSVVRLRQILSGKIVAPTTAVLATQLANGLPHATPRQLLETIISAHGVAAKGALAGIITRKTAASLAWAKAKIAAMLLAVTALAGAGSVAVLLVADHQSPSPAHAAPTPSRAGISSPATLPDDSAAGANALEPGDILLAARWDVLLNDEGLDAIKQVPAQSIKTNSKGYDAILCNADAIRAAVLQAKATNGLEGPNQDMGITQSFSGKWWMPQILYFNYWRMRNGLAISFRGTAKGTEDFSDAGNQRLHLKIHYGIDGRVGKPDSVVADSNDPFPSSIEYVGDLGSGDAVAFFNTVTGPAGISYHHLIVWEVFAAAPLEMPYLRINGCDWWCENGPERVRAISNTAVVWAAGSKHPYTQVPADFQKTLDDGTVIRLVGLCQNFKWPYCWWDPQGLPVAPPVFGESIDDFRDGTTPLHALIEMRCSHEVGLQQYPTGHPRPDKLIPAGDFTQMARVDLNNSDKVTAGAAVGPWRLVAEIDPNGSFVISDVHYQVSQVTPDGDKGFYIQVTADRDTSDEIVLTAVTKDGAEIDPRYFRSIVFGSSQGVNASIYDGISVKDLKSFRVWQRKRQFVTFDHLPTQPIAIPKTDVTPAEVAAAQALLAQREKPAHP